MLLTVDSFLIPHASQGKGVDVNEDGALEHFRRAEELGDSSAHRFIETILERGRELLVAPAEEQITRTLAGAGILSAIATEDIPVEELLDVGDNLLHAAARRSNLVSIRFFYTHPCFDALVVGRNRSGLTPREVIPLGSSEELVALRGLLHCRRSTKAACFLFCHENRPSESTPLLMLPKELIYVIADLVSLPVVGDLED
jgi:hypothetical protein